MTARCAQRLWFGWLRWLPFAVLHGVLAAPAVEVVLTTNAAPTGYLEVTGVEAGEFTPLIWQDGTLNFLPDLRAPLLAPRSGTFRNIYAPSAVETTGGYRLFYGAWDGVPTGNDRIYSATTDLRFQDFVDRHSVQLGQSHDRRNSVPNPRRAIGGKRDARRR